MRTILFHSNKSLGELYMNDDKTTFDFIFLKKRGNPANGQESYSDGRGDILTAEELSLLTEETIACDELNVF